MMIVTYKGGQKHISTDRVVLRRDDQGKKELKNKPPLQAWVSEAELGSVSVRGHTFPKGEPIEVTDEVGWKCLAMGCFEVYGDEKSRPAKLKDMPLLAPKPLEEFKGKSKKAGAPKLKVAAAPVSTTVKPKLTRQGAEVVEVFKT